MLISRQTYEKFTKKRDFQKKYEKSTKKLRKYVRWLISWLRKTSKRMQKINRTKNLRNRNLL